MFKFRSEKKHVMSKNLMVPAVECLENGNQHVYRKLFNQKQSRKFQEPRNKQNKIKKINRTVKFVHKQPAI